MEIVFLSNFFNYHQKALSEALFKQTNGNYIFVATEEMSSDRKEMGWGKDEQPSYVIDYTNPIGHLVEQIEHKILEADVVIIGSAPYSMVKNRLKHKKLVFFYSERPLKRKPKFHSMVHLAISNWVNWGRYKNAYLLSASAYSYPDYRKLLSFNNRAYKWGYFPETIIYNDILSIIDLKEGNSRLLGQGVSILWVARLIDWKHPEMPILLAERLKKGGIRFDLKMIGLGPEEPLLRRMIVDKSLDKNVHLLGAMTAQDVRNHMEESDIFIFTSDRNEGWGAVLNESMNSACAVVASNAIGSVPFLIENYKNGLIYKDMDINDLYDKTLWLINNPKERRQIQLNAYKTIVEMWNADYAAKCLIKLSNCILNATSLKIDNGPCSKANKSIITRI